MPVITVVATIVAKPGQEAVVEQALLELIPPSRKDPGFIQYDLHRDIKNPALYIFFENWESEALLNQHLASPHLKAFLKKIDGMLDKFEVNMLHKIS